jgi:hypothetical protein
MKTLAANLSRCDPPTAALAAFYDNRAGFRAATLFRNGAPRAEFGDGDELWVPLYDDGETLPDANPIAANNLNPEIEYGCIRDAIEVGLAGLGTPPQVTRHTLKDAFCYGRSKVLAETD